MKILLVEDNQHLAQQLADALSVQRYAVDVAHDGLEGWEYLQGADYDVVILDVMLPKLDGVSLCRRIRDHGNRVPVLMLTALGTSQQKVTGLDAGADDYLTKPVGVEELGARIRALLRRGHREVSPMLTWGDLKLDPNLCEVTYGDSPLNLTPKEYALLELFLRNQQRVYSRQAILDQLWSFADDLPGEDTVKSHIKGLRHKLKAVGAKDLIETVYGLGYRLNTLYLHPQASAKEPAKESAKAASAPQSQIIASPSLADRADTAIDEGVAAQETAQGVREKVRSLVVFDREAGWSSRLLTPETAQGWQVQTFTEDSEGMNLLEADGASAELSADAVVLCLSLGEAIVLELLDRLTYHRPELPVLILTDGHSFEQRRALMHRHHAGFIDKASPRLEILAAIAQVIDQGQAAHTQLLLVSDDLTLGQSVQSLLAPWDCHVSLLHNLQDLWLTLDTLSPTLLILDSQAFGESGFELCQLLRQDRRWGWLPILMLGENTTHVLQKAFMAGADDFASQPIVGPELVTRVLNRLERIQAIKALPERDALTGLSERSTAIQEFNRLIQLAKRSQQSIYVALLEIDGFAQIEQQHGKAISDRALQQLGQLLSEAIRQGDRAGRWGDTQFVLGAYGTTAQEGIDCLKRLLMLLQRSPIALGSGQELTLSFSAGVVQYPTHGAALQTLCQAAESSLRRAQAKGVAQMEVAAESG